MQELTKSKDLYRSTPVQIPAPEFVVFYNGTTLQPERAESCLSDLYEIPADKPKLELIVTTLNINLGYNRELMEKCRTLWDYATYVGKVRTYIKTMSPEEAVQKAVDKCIQDDILKEFLLSQKAEVIKVSIYEFDQAKHDETLREEGEIKTLVKNILTVLSLHGSIPENCRLLPFKNMQIKTEKEQ